MLAVGGLNDGIGLTSRPLYEDLVYRPGMLWFVANELWTGPFT